MVLFGVFRLYFAHFSVCFRGNFVVLPLPFVPRGPARLYGLCTAPYCTSSGWLRYDTSKVRYEYSLRNRGLRTRPEYLGHRRAPYNDPYFLLSTAWDNTWIYEFAKIKTWGSWGPPLSLAALDSAVGRLVGGGRGPYCTVAFR